MVKIKDATDGGPPPKHQTTVFIQSIIMAAIRKLLPLGNRILISRIVADTQTASGIFLPEAAQKRPNEGTVVAVGPGLKDEDGKFIPVNVVEGDTVLLPEYGGTEVQLGDDTFQLFRDDDILGKFE
jgi:chaperonin GroES